MPSSSKVNEPGPGKIWLVLIPSEEHPPGLYLELTLDEIPNFTTRPLKFLRYLGDAILGQEGFVSGQEDQPTGDGDTLVDRAVYMFTTNVAFRSQRMINRVVLTMQDDTASSESQSTSQCRRTNFREELLQRDADDIFAVTPSTVEADVACAKAAHIIPHARGDEWLDLIIENRTEEADYGLRDISGLDDIRNGFMVSHTVSQWMGNEDCGVIVTPNRILGTEDIPDRLDRDLGSQVSYPIGRRFTLQSFIPGSTRIDSNVDASFHSSENLPSMLLLQYHYAGCALKRWGRNLEVVDPKKLHRPEVAIRESTIPCSLDRKTATEKRRLSEQTQKMSKRKKSRHSDEVLVPKTFSMMDIVLELSMSSGTAQAAQARREREALEFSFNKRMDTRSWVESTKLSSPQPPDQDAKVDASFYSSGNLS